MKTNRLFSIAVLALLALYALVPGSSVAASSGIQPVGQDLSATLQVTVIADSVTVFSNDPIGLTITVTNTGQQPAYGVKLQDQLNSQATWNSDSKQCTIDPSGVLSCDFGTLLPLASASVHLSATSNLTTTTTLTNTAEAWATNTSKTTSNSASLTVVCEPDVTITKTASAAQVDAGQPISFTVKIKNIGSDTADWVVMDDLLPVAPGLSWSIQAPVPSGCQILSGSLKCSYNSLNSGSSRTVTITSPTDETSCGLIENTATVSAKNELDKYKGNNSASASVEVVCPQVADVQVIKTAADASVDSGQAVSFDVRVENTKAVTALNVKLTDRLPEVPGMSWSIVDPTLASECNILAGTLICDYGNLPGGEYRSVTITSLTTTDSCGDVANTAIVSSDNDSDPSNNESTATVNVRCPSATGLTITKQADVCEITGGDTIGFMISVTNNGTIPASNLVIKDPLPIGFTWSWSTTPSTGIACSVVSQVLTCNMTTLDVGATVNLHVTAGTTTETCGEFVNAATVSADNFSEVGSRDASVIIDCPQYADVQISKSAESAYVEAGQPVRFMLRVDNISNSIANGVVLTDTLPVVPDMNWSIAGSVPGCDIASGILSCTFGDIAGGDYRMVTITSPTTANSCSTQPISNTAGVSSDNDIYPPGNNSSTATVLVACPSTEPNLVLTKEADQTSVVAGETVGFTITVSNTGGAAADNVLIEDQLAPDLVWSWTPEATCTIDNTNLLSCDLGTLDAGASVTVHVQAPIPTAGCTANYDITNTATATWGTSSQVSSTPAQVNVVCGNTPVLVLTKTADASSVQALSPIGYTLTLSNTGGAAATDVILEDQLSSALDWTSTVTPDTAGTCSISATKYLTCNFASVAVGDSEKVSVHVTAQTTTDVCGTVDNTAFAEAFNHGRVQSETVPVTVTCAQGVNIMITKTAEKTTVYPGEPIVFTMTVSNNGQNTANGVTLNDPLSDQPNLNWSIVAPAPSECSITTNTLSCDYGNLLAGESRTVAVSTPTDQVTTSLAVTNTATVSATNETPGNEADNTATAEVTVPFADCISLNVFGGKYTNSFEGGFPAQIGISNYKHSVAPKGQGFLGDYGNQTVTMTISCLPSNHTEVIISFDLYIIRSWDGNNTVTGPDHWKADVEGGPVLLDTTFSNWPMPGYNQSYPDNFGQGDFPAMTDAALVNNLGYSYSTINMDSIYHLAFRFPHQGDTVVLNFTGSGLQPLFDESWGMDNFTLVPTGPYNFYVPFVNHDAQTTTGSPQLEGVTENKYKLLQAR